MGGAIGTLERGRSVARGIPFQDDLTDELDRQLRWPSRAGPPRIVPPPPASCTSWPTASASSTGRTTSRPETSVGWRRAAGPSGKTAAGSWQAALGAALEPVVRDDLLDLAIFWADLQVRLAPPARRRRPAGRRWRC